MVNCIKYKLETSQKKVAEFIPPQCEWSLRRRNKNAITFIKRNKYSIAPTFCRRLGFVCCDTKQSPKNDYRSLRCVYSSMNMFGHLLFIFCF